LKKGGSPREKQDEKKEREVALSSNMKKDLRTRGGKELGNRAEGPSRTRFKKAKNADDTGERRKAQTFPGTSKGCEEARRKRQDCEHW